MKMRSILSGLNVVCAACMDLAASCAQGSNEPADDIDAAISVREARKPCLFKVGTQAE
jgi:hypothetical protein